MTNSFESLDLKRKTGAGFFVNSVFEKISYQTSIHEQDYCHQSSSYNTESIAHHHLKSINFYGQKVLGLFLRNGTVLATTNNDACNYGTKCRCGIFI